MVVVIDPQIAGISGDMILCSLVDLGASKAKILDGIRLSQKLFSPAIRRIDFAKADKRGINATRLELEIQDDTASQSGARIKDLIMDAAKLVGLTSRAVSFAKACIDTLILSESRIHGIKPDSVHLHEAASIDTLVDILGVAIAADDLKIFDEEILCMPVCVGSGTVTFSHGTMSNPAGAILEIFKESGLQIQGNPSNAELTTPTGACILVNLCNGSITHYPKMNVRGIGYGAGQKDFKDFANVLKVVQGTKDGLGTDSVKILETNVDDVSGEILGNMIERLMDRGAKDASIYHGITKKGRPTNLVRIICDAKDVEALVDILVLETGTLGVRISESDRFVVPRSGHRATVRIGRQTFEVSYKRSSFKGKSDFKIEFDDLKRISAAISKSIKETESTIRKVIEDGSHK